VQAERMTWKSAILGPGNCETVKQVTSGERNEFWLAKSLLFAVFPPAFDLQLRGSSALQRSRNIQRNYSLDELIYMYLYK
jgi:hypothetical protein